MSAQPLSIVDNVPRQRAERIPVTDAIPVLDTGRFEQMVRIAKVMASSNLIPETLCTTSGTVNGQKEKVALPFETVMANCFLIVNQAVGWNMDPFAVAQCASVVHGRVCYEGKLIAAVLDQRAGVTLSFEWHEAQGDALAISVSGTLAGETSPRVVKGTVGGWKTTGANSPWSKPAQARLQLAYRGAREWARLHKPAVILGVYSIDELEAATDRQERRPPPPMFVTDAPAPAPHKAPSPVIEHKPAVEMPPVAETRAPVATPQPEPPRQQRRPPAPPQSVTAGTINEEGGFPSYKARVTHMLNDCPDEAACDRVFDAMVTKQMGKLTQVQYEELNEVLNARLREFEPGGEAVVWEDGR